MTVSPVALISPVTIVLIVIAVLLIAAIVFLYIFGRKQQKKMEESQAQIEANAQQVTMLVIDKKKMKLKDAGLPQMVVDATPKFARFSKVPIVKAKVGPKVMSMVADSDIFDMIPVKQEIKATVSGIYITKVRSLRGPSLVKPTKRTFRQKLMAKAKETVASNSSDAKSGSKSSAKTSGSKAPASKSTGAKNTAKASSGTTSGTAKTTSSRPQQNTANKSKKKKK